MQFKALLKTLTFFLRFTPNYTKIGYYARSLTWAQSEPYNFSGQTWVITGAAGGLGEAIMHSAAIAGADVYAIDRNPEALQTSIASLSKIARSNITPVVADMSLQAGTTAVLDQIKQNTETIDVLINNVGVLLREHSLTIEGRETSFVTNVLSHFQLTEGLIDKRLLSTDGVVVNMSSGGMYNAPLGTRRLNTLDSAAYHGSAAYNFAKRAQVALTSYWNEQHAASGLRFYVTHPGWAKTQGVKSSMPTFWKIQNILLRTPRQGADTAIWLCATRPAISQEEVIWFDRKPRSTHLSGATRNPRCTVDELVDYLRVELQKDLS